MFVLILKIRRQFTDFQDVFSLTYEFKKFSRFIQLVKCKAYERYLLITTHRTTSSSTPAHKTEPFDKLRARIHHLRFLGSYFFFHSGS